MFWVKRTDLVRQSSRVYCVTNQNATFSTRLMHELGVELHEEVEQCTAWRRSWTTLVWPCMYDRLLLYDCARELLSTVKCMTMRCMTGWSMTVSINSQLNLELWIASPCTLLWTQTSARHVNQTVVHFDIKQLILHKLFRFYEFKLHFHIEQLLPTHYQTATSDTPLHSTSLFPVLGLHPFLALQLICRCGSLCLSWTC